MCLEVKHLQVLRSTVSAAVCASVRHQGAGTLIGIKGTQPFKRRLLLACHTPAIPGRFQH